MKKDFNLRKVFLFILYLSWLYQNELELSFTTIRKDQELSGKIREPITQSQSYLQTRKHLNSDIHTRGKLCSHFILYKEQKSRIITA